MMNDGFRPCVDCGQPTVFVACNRCALKREDYGDRQRYAKRRRMDEPAPRLPSVDEAIAHLRGAAQPGWYHGPAALALIAEVERQRTENARLIGEIEGQRIGVRVLKEKIARLEPKVDRVRLLVEAAEAYAAAVKEPEAGPEHFVDQYGEEEKLGAAVLDAAAKFGGAR